MPGPSPLLCELEVTLSLITDPSRSCLSPSATPTEEPYRPAFQHACQYTDLGRLIPAGCAPLLEELELALNEITPKGAKVGQQTLGICFPRVPACLHLLATGFQVFACRCRCLLQVSWTLHASADAVCLRPCLRLCQLLSSMANKLFHPCLCAGSGFSSKPASRR